MARIQVRPNNDTEMYYWKNYDGSIECSKLNKNYVVSIKPKDIVKHMKLKFKALTQYTNHIIA